MKTAKDPRHLKREQLLKNLYSYSFSPEGTDLELIKPIVKKLVIIDKKISRAAPDWPVEKINKVDLSILRLAVFELLAEKEPVKVIIDEAVELAKEYGGEKSSQFVNGALGNIVEKNGFDAFDKLSTSKLTTNEK